jgi:hypothetical protein
MKRQQQRQRDELNLPLLFKLGPQRRLLLRRCVTAVVVSQDAAGKSAGVLAVLH